MKRVIKANAELPAGYLKTNRFNSRVSDNNVLEAIEIAISQKFNQFQSFMDRQMYLTSGTGWTGTVDQYEDGYYIQLEATRSQFNAFVSGDTVIRKPVNPGKKVASYRVSGDAGHVEFISPPTKYVAPAHDDSRLGEWRQTFNSRTDQTIYSLSTKLGSARVSSFYGDEPEDFGYEVKVYDRRSDLTDTEFFYGEAAKTLAMSYAEDALLGNHEESVESVTEVNTKRQFAVKPKQNIKASTDPAQIADKDRITSGRCNLALQINWNVDPEDADRLINGRCNGEMCGSLPLKNSFVSVDYDNDGVAKSKGYKRGFVVTDTSGHRLYYGICDDMNENIEYITMRRKK